MLDSIWRKGNPPALFLGMQIGAVTVKNSMEVLQQTEKRTTTWSSNSTPAYIPKTNKDTNLKRYMHPNAHSSMETKTWKQPKCPSTDDWIRRGGWYTRTRTHTNGVLAIKKNETLPSEATMMDQENIMLSELSLTQKDKYYMISLSCRIYKNNTNECMYKTERDSRI